MITFDLNWVAVVAAALSTMVIGFVWYMPQVFGTKWAETSGRSMSDMQMAPTGWIVVVIAALVSAWAVALVVRAVGAEGIVDGAIVGVVGWLGFSAAASFSDRMFGGGTMAFWTIGAAYRLVSFAVMGAILATL